MRTAAADRVLILGSRGVPASHGGFETLAEQLSLHLVARGWRVTVYCQQEGRGSIRTDEWRGVERVLIPVTASGAIGTVLFDWRATLHAARQAGTALVLGYNTAAFVPFLRAAGKRVIINMDGIEWQRDKWSKAARGWLRVNERIGAAVAHALIADHPEIALHLQTFTSDAKITTIPYGAFAIDSAPVGHVESLGLAPKRYMLVVARLEPENSVAEIVRAYSARSRPYGLAVVGPVDAETNTYHRALLAAAGNSVRFLGPIYDQESLAALRFHALAHLHGHTVGGTNPSLVEAMGAHNAIIAHDNRFNRWVAGESAVYFSGEADLRSALDRLDASDEPLEGMRRGSRARFEKCFTWPQILSEYESLLTRTRTREAVTRDG